jgi:hypothetical protein
MLQMLVLENLFPAPCSDILATTTTMNICHDAVLERLEEIPGYAV